MNAPKVILLHVDDSAACVNHARLAQRLAERLDAEVQALYAVTPSVARHPASSLEGAWTLAQAIVELDEQQRVATKAGFTTVIGQLPRVRWVESPGDTAWDFPRRALYADLVMVRPLEAQHDEVPRDFAATVAIESGKPVLVLPANPSLQEVGTHVLVAWKPTREAARAVTAALCRPTR